MEIDGVTSRFFLFAVLLFMINFRDFAIKSKDDALLKSRRTLLHAPEMEDDISHIESHPITVAEIFSSSFYLSSFSDFELNIFQILKSIGHENGKRNIETQGQATV